MTWNGNRFLLQLIVGSLKLMKEYYRESMTVTHLNEFGKNHQKFYQHFALPILDKHLSFDL